MSPERWQQVKQVFTSAIEYAPGERSLFLADACRGDDSLRKEVEELIASHEKEGSFIDLPAYVVAGELLKEQALNPGQVIASYEIVSQISKGGMGEVYLAKDRRLNRNVAVKVLPPSFTTDTDRLRRFEQEARTASALNHPNIITIHEVLKVNSSHLIVTEFVEGETLRQRLVWDSLTFRDTLQIAIQIADALTAAHKAGIIHRDIKPENIMLRPDGYVKVLDFGLAKLADRSFSGDGAEAQTRQIKTGSGIVMGTAGYMSPEQARGLEVDERSDIFSLGAVIYEMVSGRKAFDGETPSDELAAILKSDPPPLNRLVPQAPAELMRIVTKALRKDREERYQVVKDLLIDLRTLKQELEFSEKLEQSVVPDSAEITTAKDATIAPSGSARQTSKQTAATESLKIEPKRHRLGTLLALIGIFLTAAAAYGFYRLLSGEQPTTPFRAMKIARLTNSGKAIDATISPDGKYLVYVLSDAGQQSLWIRQVSTANDKQILPPAPLGFFGISISPDGNDLYYTIKANLDQGTLYRIPLLGGTPVKLLEKIDSGVSFSPDGKQVVFLRNSFPNAGDSALVIVNADGSSERTLAVRRTPERFTPIYFAGPAWSPDGKLVAATVASLESASHIFAFHIDDGTEKLLAKEAWPFIGRVQWLPDMSGLTVIAGDTPAWAQIWFISYPGTERTRITNDLNSYRTIALSADGSKLSTIQSSGLVNIWVAPDGDSQRAIQLPTGNVGFYTSRGHTVSWTPDGRIVFLSNESGNLDIWIMDADGGNRKQLTFGGGQNASPVVTKDGQYIVFVSDRAGPSNIWRMKIDGTEVRRLTTGPADSLPSVSPDAKWVVYSSLSNGESTLWKVGLDGRDAIQLTSHRGTAPVISPDGKLIAYLYSDSPDPNAPANQIKVIWFSGGAPIKTFSFQTTGIIALLAQWSPDGASIQYPVTRNNVTNLWGQPLDGGPPRQVTDFKDNLMTGFAWSRDGKQLACTRGILQRDAVLITDVR